MRPSLLPFLVSTLRPTRLKLRERILETLTTSPAAARSSVESIMIPSEECSRMEDTVKMSVLVLAISGPVRRKAIILSASGSTIIESIVAILLVECMLRIGVPIRLFADINIS